jgi:hypothetical protein
LRHWSAAQRAKPLTSRQTPEVCLRRIIQPVVLDQDGLLTRLGGLLTEQLTLAGEEGLPLIDLHVDLQRAEDALATRYERPPTPEELAGEAVRIVEQEASSFPALARLRDLYDAHALALGASDDGATAIDRFRDQVASLSLSTCIDSCPACLAGSCDLGAIEETRHTLSRAILRSAHRLLTRKMVVDFRPEVDAQQLEAVARQNGGWVILTYCAPLPTSLVLGCRDRFDDIARLFDFEHIEVRRVLKLREAS